MDKLLIEQYKKDNPFIVLADIIYQGLKDDIMQGKLLPGDRIVESEIARSLAISRTPVGIAVNRGLREGWLERKSQRFLTVSKISPNECFFLYEARKSLEGEAAYLAAKRVTKEQLQEMREILLMFRKEHDKPIDEDFFCVYDEKFHDLVVKAADNPYLWEMYQRLKPDLQRYRYHYKQLITERNTSENVYMYHYSIYLAIRSRLGAVARDEIEADISSMHGMIFAGNVLAKFNLQ